MGLEEILRWKFQYGAQKSDSAFGYWKVSESRRELSRILVELCFGLSLRLLSEGLINSSQESPSSGVTSEMANYPRNGRFMAYQSIWLGHLGSMETVLRDGARTMDADG